jgi:glycosyltransferase involved in cell wall biosynthesis
MLNKPVISTNFDVVYNQLRDGENGLIVQMDPEKIADAIVRLWKNADLRNHIVENLKREKKGNPEEIEKLYRMIEE